MMLYYRYSPTRTFFLNEYWILIPSAILVNYFVIRKIRSDREKMEQLRNLQARLERERKIRRILLLSLGLTGCRNFLPRGGSTDFINVVNVDYIKCDIEKGIRYLDDNRLRNIIHDLYKHKRKGKIIYITATALCHLADRYGQKFFALPIAVGDFGFTNLYQTLRKLLVTTLLGGVGPLYYIGTPSAIFFAFILGTSGLTIGFNNLEVIETSFLDDTKDVKPRIPSMPDVVVVNNHDKISMSRPVQENQECWLPDQQFLNRKCNVKTTEIPDATDSVLSGLKYEEAVNMNDVTGLDQVEFTDKYDFGHTEPSICKPRKGKEVHFLDQFGDSGPIGESEKWDTCENEFRVPEERYLRTRNKP